MITYLENIGANIHTIDVGGGTPLKAARLQNHVDIILFFRGERSCNTR